MRVTEAVIHIYCSAPRNYFEEVLTEESVKELEQNGPINCEGSGASAVCYGCRFCKLFDWDSQDFGETR